MCYNKCIEKESEVLNMSALDLQTLHRSGSDNMFHCTDSQTDEDIVIDEMFPSEYWDCPEAYKMAGIRGYEPMTAKELETDEQQDEKLKDSAYIIEEKFDGTRALVYFLSQKEFIGTHAESLSPVYTDIGFCRVFSRRISKKTGFYVENTDSLPQLRELDIPELAGTILDGEMFIDGLPFKEVSSTLNCLWDKAIDRQIEKGFITFHAFDILFYKGIDLRKMPLERRKVYLHLAVEEADSPYVKEVEYFECGATLSETNVNTEIAKRFGYDKKEIAKFLENLEFEEKDTYPHLYECWSNGRSLITPRAYYELIVATGGEGLIVKPKSGKYQHKRGWEYSKIKKFLTRELIVIGFSEPTKEYTGKDVRKWGFWVEKETDRRVQGNFYGDKKYIPVTRHYFYNQVGNLLLGVLISVDDYNAIPKNKRGVVYELDDIGLSYDTTMYIMEVCECSGFDDDTREYFTRNKDKMIGTVIEVKANELFRDSGKMRHPRYMRQRFDKEPEECIWEDHIGTSEVTK